MSRNNHIQQLTAHAIKMQAENKLDEAIFTFRRVLAIDDKNSQIINNLGLCLLEKNKLAEVTRLFTRLRIYHPNPKIFIESYKKLGLKLLDHGYKKQALEWLKHVETLDPNSTDIQTIIRKVSLPTYLNTFAYDSAQDKWFERYAPYENTNYVYAIDIVGTCNLKCPSCPVANMADDIRPKGFMPLGLFKDILEKIKKESPVPKPEIWLFNWGEPLLHPDLKEIILATKSHDWPVMISTNLNVKKGLDQLIESNPHAIKISLSGISEKTYSTTHARGNIDLVKSNLYLLKSLMNKYQAHLPQEKKSLIYLGYHLYKDNLDEAKQAALIAQELGFGYAENAAIIQPVEKVMQILDGQPNAIEPKLMSKLLTHPTRLAREIKKKRSGQYDCELRFNMTSINYDGSVGLCCSTYAQENQLAPNFLSINHQELEEKKYQQSFCKKCMGANLHYSLCDIVPE